MHLSQINLNLLVILDALLTECHVTRAAKKVFLSQSAVSCSLNQLRDLFQDDLLVREGQKMTLTLRAQALLPQVKQTIQQIEWMLGQHQHFDPATSDRVFTIGMTEYADFVLLPQLYAHLHTAAPHIKLIVKHLIPMGTEKVFETGEIDLGVGMRYDLPHLVNQVLFKERMVCLARKDHPLFKKRMTLSTYNKAKHIDFTLREQHFFGISNEELSKMGVDRSVYLVASHIVPALHALASSDLIATVQEGMFKQASRWFHLVFQAPPFTLPSVTFAQIWHKRFQNDAGHQWLRGIIKEIAEKIYS